MAISKIEIRNFKSISHLVLELSNRLEDTQKVRCFVGKNGVGKSNIAKALCYYWNNLCGHNIKYDVVDSINPYNLSCRIAVSFDFADLLPKIKGNTYLEEQFHEIKLECKNHFPVSIEMVQDRNGNLNWNYSYKVRKFIETIFPLYFIDTRRLDLMTWEYIWDIISDLASTAPIKNDAEEVKQILDETFSKIYGEKYKRSVKIAHSIFESNSISMDKYHYNSRFRDTFSMRFGGQQFNYDSHALKYYSDGSNSFMYIKLLLEFISKISDVSCKTPIMIIDEPEIGLHYSKIEDLVLSIKIATENHLFLLMNTHSPKLIESMVNQSIPFEIFHISSQSKYTECRLMNTNILAKGRHSITVVETSCYFADALLLVEGQSEVQLFKKSRLIELFPFLRKVEVYPTNSNDQLLGCVHPKDLNLGIPYLLMYDMDKIIEFREYPQNSNCFKVDSHSNKFNPVHELLSLKGKKQYDYTKDNPNSEFLKKFKQYKAVSFHYAADESDQQLHYVEDVQFDDLITDVKNYCKVFHVFANRTTIEGLVVTEQNIDKFEAFYEHKKNPKTKLDMFNIENPKERTALVRVLLLNGRGELSKKISYKIEFSGKQKIFTFQKTDGWMPEWIDYYFKQYLDIIKGQDEKRELFKIDFPELYSALQSIWKML